MNSIKPHERNETILVCRNQFCRENVNTLATLYKEYSSYFQFSSLPLTNSLSHSVTIQYKRAYTSFNAVALSINIYVDLMSYLVAWRFELASSTSGSGDGANDLDEFVVNVVIIALQMFRFTFCAF